MGLCAERKLFLANTFFEHKHIHRYTWRRVECGGVEQRSLIDYIVVEESMRKCVQDARVVRGIIDISDHYMVVAEMYVNMKWIQKVESVRCEERVDWQKLKEEKVREKYKKELRKLNENLERGRYGSNVDKLWEDSYKGILEIVDRLCGRKKVTNGKKGDAWWNSEINEGVKKKRAAWKKTLQRNVTN